MDEAYTQATRSLLDLGAVPLKDFLRAPYTYPRSRPPGLPDVDGLSIGSQAVTEFMAAGSHQPGEATPAEAEARNKRKRAQSNSMDKPTVMPVEEELEEGELVEEKKKKRKKKKKSKKAAQATKGDG
jgi:hypothetical protein